MNCREAEALISAWLDKEITPLEEQHMETHLAQCSGCQALRREWLILDRLTREAQPTWLGNPAGSFSMKLVSAPDHVAGLRRAWHFEVGEAYRGMKWTAMLGPENRIDTGQLPYLTLCYRAHNVVRYRSGKRHNDFFILLYDKDEREVIPLNLYELKPDGEWDVAVALLPPMEIEKVVLQVQAEEEGAFVEISSLDFSSHKPEMDIHGVPIHHREKILVVESWVGS